MYTSTTPLINAQIAMDPTTQSKTGMNDGAGLHWMQPMPSPQPKALGSPETYANANLQNLASASCTLEDVRERAQEPMEKQGKYYYSIDLGHRFSLSATVTKDGKMITIPFISRDKNDPPNFYSSQAIQVLLQVHASNGHPVNLEQFNFGTVVNDETLEGIGQIVAGRTGIGNETIIELTSPEQERLLQTPLGKTFKYFIDDVDNKALDKIQVKSEDGNGLGKLNFANKDEAAVELYFKLKNRQDEPQQNLSESNTGCLCCTFL